MTPFPPTWSQLGVHHQHHGNIADTVHNQSVVHPKEGSGHEQLWDKTRALIERIERMVEEDSNSVRGRELSIFLGKAGGNGKSVAAVCRPTQCQERNAMDDDDEEEEFRVRL